LTIKEELIARGMEKGIEKGRQEGLVETRFEVATKLIKRNVAIDEICDLTDLSYEEVFELMKNEK
jgi:predicted transposase/invertase (TIGR01784 family)